MMKKFTAVSAALIAACSLRADAPKLENLGEPVRCGEMQISGVSREGGKTVAWSAIRLPERRGIAGIDVDSGKVSWVNLDKYNPQSLLARVHGGKVYAFLRTEKGTVVEYDIASGKTVEHSVPVSGGDVISSSADISSDGKL